MKQKFNWITFLQKESYTDEELKEAVEEAQRDMRLGYDWKRQIMTNVYGDVYSMLVFPDLRDKFRKKALIQYNNLLMYGK